MKGQRVGIDVLIYVSMYILYGGIQPQGCDWMEPPRPSRSTVKEYRSKFLCRKVLLSMEGDGYPGASTPSQHLDQVVEGGILEPNTRTLDLWGLRQYLHFGAYWATMSIMDCRSSGEEAKRARLSAYIGTTHNTLSILAPSPECSSYTRSLTNKL